MADFNADNAKIEAALTALSARNCRCCCMSYTGDGATSRTFTFSCKPVLLVLISDTSLTVLNRGLNKGITFWSRSTQYDFPVAWGEKSVTLSDSDGNTQATANIVNWTYGLFALLEVE